MQAVHLLQELHDLVAHRRVRDGAVNGQLDEPQQKDRYHFDGQQGRAIEAQVQRTSGVALRPWLELVDPTGTTEADATIGAFTGTVTLSKVLASSGTTWDQ